MQPSNKAIDLIKQFEGFYAKAYLCPAGKLTIGYGHAIKPHEEQLKTATLTEEQATELMLSDLKPFENHINSTCSDWEVTLNQQQFDALCSFCFNTGYFTNDMVNRFKAKDITAIGNSLTLYNKANGKVLAGLTRRRQAEKELFFS